MKLTQCVSCNGYIYVDDTDILNPYLIHLAYKKTGRYWHHSCFSKRNEYLGLSFTQRDVEEAKKQLQ